MYITHVYTSDLGTLPQAGIMQRIKFFKQPENDTGFFLDVDNKQYSRQEIGKMVFEEKLMKLDRRIVISDIDALFIDDAGKLWLAHWKDSSRNRLEIGAYDIYTKMVFLEMEGGV